MKTLPPVTLGTWSWGTGFAGGDTVFGNHLSDTQMAEVFTAAMSKGLNLWDTAAVYGMGSSETALGALVRQFPRENIILSTKLTPQIADKQSAQPVSDMLPRHMLTLPHFQFIYALMGAERILFSVDYPYQALDGVKTFIDSLPVNKAEKEAIAFRNAERLLGITV